MDALQNSTLTIALTSPNGQTLAGHAGKCPGFLLWRIENARLLQQSHIKLSREQTLRHLEGGLSQHPNHPLHGISAFVTQGLGEGLKHRLKSDGIAVYETDLDEPLAALEQLGLLSR